MAYREEKPFMYCEPKDDLYRTLIQIRQADRRRGELFSHEYITCVEAIKEHDRSGHDGQRCPDAGY